MKSKKNIAIALALALTTVCAVGAGTAFAADTKAQAAAKPAVTASVQEISSKTKDMSAKKSSFDKGSITFVGIDAVAAEVLGVSKESLSELNYADQLYAELTEAGKLNISIKDIQRIFNTSGSEAVLGILGKKVDAIDEEVSLLHELREIVLDFILQIEKADFHKESDVKLIYEKAKEIETQIVNVDYNGNPSMVNRLLEVTEKLDNKVPDIMIVKIPKFRAVTSGLMTFDELFGGGFGVWQEAHNHLFKPVIFDCPDFLYGKDDKVAWLWAVKDDVTEPDTQPYGIIEYPGGLYAVAVSVDGDGESHDKVRSKTAKWLENTNFVIDSDREFGAHMIYVDDEIKEGLGYHQLNLYAPIKLKRNVK